MIDKRKFLGTAGDPYTKSDEWEAHIRGTERKEKVSGRALSEVIVDKAREQLKEERKLKKAPTLADVALRETFGKHHTVMPTLRSRLAEAKRFVLDEGASAFLSDLAHANFSTKDGAYRALDASLSLARLPHATTWIEYDSQAERRRTLEAYGTRARAIDGDALSSPEECCHYAGWLMWQHPKLETAFRMVSIVGEKGTAMQIPFDMVWTTDETPLPWSDHVIPEHSDMMAHLATGISGYKNPHIGIVKNDMTPRIADPDVRKALIEWGSELRRVLTLLAAINDVPIGVKAVTATQGFVAQGRYRKFMDHSVISILLPKGRDPQKVARNIIARARKRAHQVRGHWRRDWRHEGNRIWVREHERGDSSLGFVTHDYTVEHEEHA